MNTFISAYTAYIFDFDGTLADSVEDSTAALRATLAAHNLPDAEISRSLIGPPVEEILAKLAPDADAAEIAHLSATFRKLYNASGTPHTVLFPGMRPLLDRLAARGARLFVATNKARSSTFAILDRLGVLPLFTEVMCCDAFLESFGRMISKAEMITHLVRKYDLEPDETVMIGDSPHDIEGGREAGVHTLGVLYGYGRPEDVAAARPEAVTDDPAWRAFLA